MTIIDPVVTGELTIPTVIADFEEEATEDTEEVTDQTEEPLIEGITRYLLCAVGKKDGINMEDIRKDEEEGGIYEGDNGMYGEECNELESAREGNYTRGGNCGG